MPNNVCPYCGKPTGDITDKIVGDQHYHLMCFNCNRCNKYLQGNFTTDPHNDKLVCNECSALIKRGTGLENKKGEDGGYQIHRPKIETDAQKCEICNEPVYKAEEVKKFNRSWHRKCFNCTKCGATLSDLNAESHENLPVCQVCYREARGIKYAINPDDPSTASGGIFPLQELRTQSRDKLKEQGVDVTKLENYISQADFVKAFKMTKEAYDKQPTWKKTQLKKDAQLY